MRAVFEMLGVHDVVAKSLGSQNPYNMIRATIDGLQQETSPRLGRRSAAARRSPTSCRKGPDARLAEDRAAEA